VWPLYALAYGVLPGAFVAYGAYCAWERFVVPDFDGEPQVKAN